MEVFEDSECKCPTEYSETHADLMVVGYSNCDQKEDHEIELRDLGTDSK